MLKMLMKMTEQVFFSKDGELGLTETSAQQYCAIATHVKANCESALQNVSFVNESMNVVGSGSEFMLTGTGINEKALNELPNLLETVSRMNGFIAWFSECREAKKNLRSEILRTEMAEWAIANNLELPIKPKNTASEVLNTTEQDVIANMNIKERNNYFFLEAKSAAFGKFIHDTNPMAAARKYLYDKIAKPHSKSGTGRDTLIMRYEPSVSPAAVDKMFMQLQHEYRVTEQNLNHIKKDIKDAVSAANIAENAERRNRIQKWNTEMQEYNKQMQQLTIQFNEWIQAETEKIAKLKFALPEALVDTFHMLQNLEKQA